MSNLSLFSKKCYYPFLALLFLFSIFLNHSSLQASIINPDLQSDYPGYEDFVKGRYYFEKEDYEQTERFFWEAIRSSYKPYYDCEKFFRAGGGRACTDDEFDEYGEICPIEERSIYKLYEEFPELTFAIYRHSQFYLGLIYFNLQDFEAAHFHLKKAIGFLDKDLGQETVGSILFRSMNLIEPSWIVLTALTYLHLGELDLAWQCCQQADTTNYYLDNDVLDYWFWERKEYWHDFQERQMDYYWCRNQELIILNTQAIILQAKKNFTEAISLMTEAIRIMKNLVSNNYLRANIPNSTLFNNRGLIYFDNCQYQEALLDFTIAIEEDPFNADVYLNRAFVHLMLMNDDLAIQDYDRATQLDPKNAVCYGFRAYANFFNGSYDQANADFAMANEIEERRLCQENESGLISFGNGEFQKSIQHFTKFIKKNPKIAAGYQNRGAALYQAGAFGEARHDFDKALVLSPNNSELYHLRGLCYLSLSLFDQAEDDFLKANLLNPNDLKILENLASVYYIQEEFEKALAYYKKIIDLNPLTENPSLYKSLAFTYFNKGDFNNSLESCNKAVKFGFSDSSLYVIKGLCFYELHNFIDAVASITKGIELGCENSSVYFNRGQAYYGLLNFDQAYRDLSKAIQIEPSNPDYYQLRGLILLHLHKESEAYSDFATAIKIVNLNFLNSQSPKKSTESKVFNFGQKTMEYKGSFLSLDGSSIYLLKNIENGDSKTSHLLGIPAFHLGLQAGIMEGGVEAIKEFGPFLANLLFHPIQTTEEIYEAISLLINEIKEREWETVCGLLAPELLELYLDWEKIENFERGKLVGQFIGKNGVNAIIGLGAVKSVGKLKDVFFIPKVKNICAIKRTQPCLAQAPPPLPTIEPPPYAIPVYPKDNWIMPYEGSKYLIKGKVINGRYYTEHALSRMAPMYDLEIMAVLEERIYNKAEQMGINIYDSEAFLKWKYQTTAGDSFQIKPRGIPPSVIEAEIANPGSTGIHVIINENGDVVSVWPGGNKGGVTIEKGSKS